MKIQNIARLGGNLEGCDCDEILERLTDLEESQCEQCCDCQAIENSLTEIRNEITNIWNKIDEVERFIHISEVVDYLAPAIRPIQGGPNPLYGIGVSVISIGQTFNFWGTGSLNNSVSLANNATYYIIEAGTPTEVPPAKPTKIPELTWYVGEPTIGTLWISDPAHSGGALTMSMPLYFDQTGIYFTTTSSISNLTPSTVFKFTQALILVES